jgi:AraC-like DNA-binding protein
MRTAVDITSRPGFTVRTVTCRDDHTGWSAAEIDHGHGLVLVRRGRFRRRVRGMTADLDQTLGYVVVPGEEERFAHPAGGDVCTWLGVAPGLWRSLAGGWTGAARSTLYVDATVDLAHRRLLLAARSGEPDFGVAEELVTLLASALRQAPRSAARRVGAPVAEPASVADRRLVAAAREAIAERHPAAEGLLDLAALLRVSPYRLSRAFPRELGVSLTRYRNRIRIARALDRIENGERNLGGLAADLGFADQAHLCRTARQHLGHTPTALRRLLGGDPAPSVNGLDPPAT